MATGTIKKLISDRGFGFITADDGKDYFFHRDGLNASLDFDRLTGGEKVSFDVESSPRGPRATAICFLRDTDPSETEHVDELMCGDLVDGKIADLSRVAVAPRGIFSLQLAVGPQGRIGVAWQAQEEDDTAISFATVTCPDVAAAPAPQ